MKDSAGTTIAFGDILIEPKCPSIITSRLHVFLGENTQNYIKTAIINHYPEKNNEQLRKTRIKTNKLVIITSDKARDYINYLIELNPHGVNENLIRENVEKLINFSISIKNNEDLSKYFPINDGYVYNHPETTLKSVNFKF